MKKPILAILISITLLHSFGQSSLGSWNILNIRQDMTNKWLINAEAQIRSLKFYDNFHYYEFKIGIQYNIHPTVAILAGIGNYDTYNSGGNFKTPMNNDETRTWVQLIFQNKINLLSIDHRYRAEQRFTSNGYRNRFRYRINLNYPITKVYKKAVSAYLWNEFFFTNKEPYFERNRFGSGINYKFTSELAMHFGFVYQFDYKINDETGKSFLQIGILLNNLLKNNNKNYAERINNDQNNNTINYDD